MKDKSKIIGSQTSASGDNLDYDSYVEGLKDGIQAERDNITGDICGTRKQIAKILNKKVEERVNKVAYGVPDFIDNGGKDD